MTNVLFRKDYKYLLREIKERVYRAQYEALRAVNKEIITLYWDIGRLIVKRQRMEKWGKSVVENLARDLQVEFPGMKGFSARNIWYMRNFVMLYGRNTKLQSLVAEISWTHNIVIMEKCKNDREREFYIKMSHQFGWTKNVLIHQIESEAYAKTLVSQTNFKKVLPPDIRRQAKLAVKDEYTFDFLELSGEYSERQFEKALMGRMDKFLRELGGALTFVGGQYRLEVGDKEYFIDILLYHRYLRCLVAMELKVGEFLPEYVGKMQFYLTALDKHVKTQYENPSIGIIVCKTKNRTIVEYALQQSKKPIGVVSYKITSQLPKGLKRELPSPEQAARLLGQK